MGLASDDLDGGFEGSGGLASGILEDGGVEPAVLDGRGARLHLARIQDDSVRSPADKALDLLNLLLYGRFAMRGTYIRS